MFNNKEYYKNYYKENKKRLLKQKKKYYLLNKTNILLNKKEYYLENSEQIKEEKRFIRKYFSQKQIVQRRNYANIYYQENKDIINIQNRLRYKNSLKYNINFILKSNLRRRLRLALKQNWKFGGTIDLLGCSIVFLKKHLESQFKEGMDWKNYGINGWHIDHVVPCAKFDLSNPEEQQKCFHYSNLQPLWAIENIQKRDRINL